MRALRPLAVLVLAVLVSGCFQTRTLLKLNADGSGTVEETVLMNSTMAMAVMMGQEGLFNFEGDDEAPEADPPEGPYSMEALEARAASMGAQFVRVEPIEILFGGGYTAVYAFDDINDLSLSSDPSDLMPSQFAGEMGMGSSQPVEFDENGEMIEPEMDEMEETATPVTFAYEGGRLTVRMPQPEPDAPDGDPKKTPEADETEEMPDDREMQQMSMMLRDMRFSFAIELPGEITETTATHTDGRLLTLYDMNFAEVFKSPEAFALMDELESAGPDMASGAMARFGQIPGIVYEASEEVTVSFQ